MRRCLLLCAIAAYIAAAAAEDCGGSPSVDPRICSVTSATKSGSTGKGALLCTDHSAIDVGQEVPIQVKIRNRANYLTKTGETKYVDGKLKAGSSIQIAFACLDEACQSAAGDVFEYTGKFEFTPTQSGASTANAVQFGMGRAKGSGMGDRKGLFKPADAHHKGGIGLCSRLSNHASACGHLTITKDLAIPSRGYVGLGIIYLRVLKRLEQPFSVQVAATTGMLETTGGTCSMPTTHAEFAAAGSGRVLGLFKGVAPPPRPKPSLPKPVAKPQPLPMTLSSAPAKKGKSGTGMHKKMAGKGKKGASAPSA